VVSAPVVTMAFFT